MNSQLLSHLATFDSDEDFSESPDLVVEEHVTPVLHPEGMIMMNPLDSLLLRLRRAEFVTPHSCSEACFKVLILLPVGIALGDYVGLFVSFTLSCICLLLFQMKPPETYHHGKNNNNHKNTLHSLDRRPSVVTINKEMGVVERRQSGWKKRRTSDCRREVSRLLGLIGAPPLQWKPYQEQAMQEDCDLDVASEGMILVVRFLEAHVQLILTIDEAFRWLQISSSLHLGLGPRSQCVERVERASIARQFRNQRRQSNGASLLVEGVNEELLEPLRNVPKSVLSLASVRQHLATTMVEQSDSLMQVWDCMHGEVDGMATAVLDLGDTLDVPDVIDLGWIKSSRQHLAKLLSHSVDQYCTGRVLAALSASSSSLSEMEDDPTSPQCQLESSLANARNAREHLLNTLLLGKTRTATPMPTESPNDPLLLSLLQYRDHLNALSGAIWSCQQYTKSSSISQEKGRLEWWEQIQELSETCRAMENDIGRRFFPAKHTRENDDEHDTEADQKEGTEGGEVKLSDLVPERYEHGEDPQVKSAQVQNVYTQSTKIQIFKGHGVMKEPSVGSKKKSSDGSNNETSVPLPPRDSISEQLMVMELQRRISKLRPTEDDDEEEEKDGGSDTEMKTAKERRAPAAPLFLGASGALLSELKLSIPSSSQQQEEQLSIGE